MEIKYLDKNSFENEVLKSDKIVLVDFYADWCGPCKMMAPVLEDLAKTTTKNLMIAKVNVDQEQELAAAYGIYSIPTLMVVKDGKVLKREPGFKPKPILEQFIDV